MDSTTAPRSPWRRLAWEFVIFALLAAAVYGAWQLQAWRYGKILEEERARSAEELAGYREAASERLDERAREHARLAFRMLLAGLSAGDGESAQNTLGALLQVPEVRFVHLFERDGTILATSDRKLEITGRVDERARWALAAGELVVREGEGGVVEVAAPLRDGDDSPILWLGWAAEEGSGLPRGNPQ